MELSGADYENIFAALTGKNPASQNEQSGQTKAADSAQQHATRRLPGDEKSNNGTLATSSENPLAPTKSRNLPALRFEDGAAYFGSTLLGRLPALF